MSDPTKETAKAFGVLGTGGLFPRRWTYYIGVDGTILHIDKDVKTSSAGADMVARLEALEISKKDG